MFLFNFPNSGWRLCAKLLKSNYKLYHNQTDSSKVLEKKQGVFHFFMLIFSISKECKKKVFVCFCNINFIFLQIMSCFREKEHKNEIYKKNLA